MSIYRRASHVLAGSCRIFLGGTRFLGNVAADFESAQMKVMLLKNEPDNTVKLKMYALFKQANNGNAPDGPRPKTLDYIGWAKYNAWKELNGMSADDAKLRYSELVEELYSAEGGRSRQENPNKDSLEISDKESKMADKFEGLNVSKIDKIFQIQFNRPEKKNAITWKMYEGIVSALNESAADKDTSVTLLTGCGDYFSSGNDLANFSNVKSPAEIPKIAKMGRDILKQYVAAFIDHPKPLIALVNGPAIGISVTVLGLFDLVLASDKATFVTPFAALGQAPEACSSYTFPRIMGTVMASEFLLFGRKLTASEAKERHLVNEIITDDQFLQKSQEIVTAYSKLPPESMRLAKILIRDQIRDQLHECNENEVTLLCDRWQSQECINAIMQFFTRK